MRNRARRSELTWGYCLPGWLEDAGLKSSTGGAVWAGVVCANASWPASRGSNTRPIDTAFMTVLLEPETNVGQTDSVPDERLPGSLPSRFALLQQTLQETTPP